MGRAYFIDVREREVAADRPRWFPKWSAWRDGHKFASEAVQDALQALIESFDDEPAKLSKAG